MHYWKKLNPREINKKITAALRSNINFEEHTCLGIPASRLDEKLFRTAQPFADQEPLFQVYLKNPNHIGCHTLGDSEIFFNGTQALEKELIELLAVDLLRAAPNATDGYVAAGGTEANLQAMWIYRNYFLHRHGALHQEIGILASADTHYSIPKAADLLHLDCYKVDVDPYNRSIVQENLVARIQEARLQGKKFFIVVANMGTTMFGSVDDPGLYAEVLTKENLPFFIHVDAAFGGFIYPFSEPANPCGFHNPVVSSITLDAHKMLQAPYGTGIFIVRKGMMEHVFTREAAYVNGFDITVSGSRSGANAVAVWLLLHTYGPFGWLEKINKLLYRTKWLCSKLNELGVIYFSQPRMNIVTIEASFVSEELVARYGLVPDCHTGLPNWYKIVIMDHVDLDLLNAFLNDLAGSCKKASINSSVLAIARD